MIGKIAVAVAGFFDFSNCPALGCHAGKAAVYLADHFIYRTADGSDIQTYIGVGFGVKGKIGTQR